MLHQEKRLGSVHKTHNKCWAEARPGRGGGGVVVTLQLQCEELPAEWVDDALSPSPSGCDWVEVWGGVRKLGCGDQLK